MEREDVVCVLRRFLPLLVPGGVVLDLQVVPPLPVVEVDGVVVCEIEGQGLLDAAADATAEIDHLIARGLLREDGVDDHDVRSHYASGAELVEDFETRQRSVPLEAVPVLVATERPCVIREACRLRRLLVT
jgi:hypothetical protein